MGYLVDSPASVHNKNPCVPLPPSCFMSALSYNAIAKQEGQNG